jgi:hypothetical protein
MLKLETIVLNLIVDRFHLCLNFKSKLKPFKTMKTKLSSILFVSVFLIFGNAFNTTAQVGNLKSIKKEIDKKVPTKDTKQETSKPDANQKSAEETSMKPLPKPEGKIVYVATTGSAKNAGTKESPFSQIEKAIEMANEYDKVYVAEGVYSGAFDVGYFEIKKPIEIYGSFNTDFTRRDPIATPTIIRTKPKSGSGKLTIIYIQETQDVVIDGLTIDMGDQNSYNQNAPEGVETGYLNLTNTGGTPQRSAIRIVGNNVTIRNNTFVNISYCGVSIGQRMNMPGKILIDNNLFVNVAHSGIDCGVLTSPRQDTKEIEISNNTFAFTYGTTFLNDNLGCAIWLKPNAKYNIHHNIFAYASDAAIRFLDYNGATLNLDHNIFVNNRMNDVHTSIHNKRVYITVEEFDEVDFVSSLEGNKRLVQKLPLNDAYLGEFFNMAADVAMEYDPNSDWNQVRSILGLPQQATGKATISFFANRYPWKESHKLFGGVSGTGAQVPNIQ